MNLKGLSDGEILWLAIYLEEECALRYLEMRMAFRYVDEPLADRFGRLARDEEAHRERLALPWRERGSPRLHSTDVQGWIQKRYPLLMEPWDRDDEDEVKAMRRVASIESASMDFYQKAEPALRHAKLREMFVELAAQESSHAG